MLPRSVREDVIWRIAELYEDLICPLNGPSGIRGDGDSWGGMPATYTPSLKEFERLLVLMREGDADTRLMRWHLVEWHLNASRVIRHEPVLVRSKERKTRRLMRDDRGEVVTMPVVRVIRNPQAREDQARKACRWLADRWSLASEPMLPKAVVSV